MRARSLRCRGIAGFVTIAIACAAGQRRGGGAFTARHIANGGNALNYNLYTTAARTTVWGDGTRATATISGTGSGLLTASTQLYDPCRACTSASRAITTREPWPAPET